MVKIRLTRMGNKKRPFYRIIVIESRSKRSGRPLDHIGYYNPMQTPAIVKIDIDKVKDWMNKGAEMTSTVASLVRKIES